MTIYYTGVGSRETPGDILNLMRDFGEAFAKRGWVLRSGAADGADQAFEEGAKRDRMTAHNMEIYLPWPKFNGHGSTLHLVHGDSHGRAAEIAASVHPRWNKLSPAVRNLHMRNVYQVLGRDLATPSMFLVCWTPDGCESKAERTEFTGGTGTAIELAYNYHVPIFNLANKGRLSQLYGLLQVSAH